MLRNVIAVAAGLAVAVLMVWLVQAIGHTIYPAPENLDWNDADAVHTYISQLPFVALLFPVASYFLGSVFGPYTATRIGTARPIILVGTIALVILAFAISTLIQLQPPVWFSALSVAAVLIGAWLALMLAGGNLEIPDDEE